MGPQLTIAMERKRMFRLVETYLWRDPRFRALRDEVKLLWLHLLTSPAHDRFRCEGLVECTYHDVARYVGWINSDMESLIQSLERVKLALGELAAIGWLEIDLGAELMLLPKAVRHNPPSNINVLTKWMRTLDSVPPSLLRVHWIYAAADTMRERYGRKDPRTVAIATVQQSLSSHVKSIEVLMQEQRQSMGIFVGFGRDGTDYVKEALARWRSGGGTVERPKRKRTAVTPPVPKPVEALDDFSERERAIWEAIRRERFYVPGVGEQTAWEQVRDPVKLCRQLGGAGYPNVPVELIARLAAWTHANPKNAKRDLQRFLVNRFSYSQERGRAGPELDSYKVNRPPRPSAQRPLDEKM